jgi:uncharacterized protein YdbL (DUF1318 family)
MNEAFFSRFPRKLLRKYLHSGEKMRIFGKTSLSVLPAIILFISCASGPSSGRAQSFPEEQIRMVAGQIEDAVLYVKSPEPVAADFKVNETTGEVIGELQPMDLIIDVDKIAEKAPSLAQLEADTEPILVIIRNRILRRATIYEMQQRGCVGENRQGYVENLKAAACSGARDERDRVAYLVLVENRDRRAIYEQITEAFDMRKSEVARIERIFAERIHQKAWAGTPLEASGGGWEKK